jgi:PKD repeat protein
MAMVTTINTPTVTETLPGTYTVSVTATLTDGTDVVTKDFSASLSSTTQAARDQIAITLAGQIVAWRASVVRIAGYATALAALKTNIEGRL